MNEGSTTYTGEYDIALQIDENVFNRALAALYYRGLFCCKKTYTFNSPGAPEELKQFAEVTYKVSAVSPPFVDFIGNDAANVLLSAQVILYLIGAIELEIDADVSAGVKIVYDAASHSVRLDFTRAEINDIRLGESLGLDEATLKKLNDVVAYIIKNDIFREFETAVVPAPLFQQTVPTVPEQYKLTVNRFDGRIIGEHRFQAGVDLFHNTAGDFNAIQLGARADYGVAVSEKVIQQLIDSWWRYTTYPKSKTETNSDPLTDIEGFVNGASHFVETALAIGTLGLVEVDTTFSNSTLNYSATVTLGKPTVDIKSGNRFSLLDTHVYADVWVNVTTDVRVTGKTAFGLVQVYGKEEQDVKLFSLTKTGIDVTLRNATGKVYLNDKLQLMGKVEQVDVTIDLGDDWQDKLTESAMNTIIHRVRGLIISHIPELPLFPEMVAFKIPELGYTLDLRVEELSSTDTEVLVRLNTEIKELKPLPAPLPAFIGNKSTKELHRAACKKVDEVNEVDKVGYYTLMNAVNDGYHLCGACISAYNKR